MKVYTVFKPQFAGLLRLWAMSWERRGWKTRILTPRDIQKHGSVKRAAGDHLFVPPTAINFSFRPPRRKPRRVRLGKFGARHWEDLPVVLFDREYDVLNCGRLI